MSTTEEQAGERNASGQLNDVLDRVIEFDSGGLPVVSLYLNAQANRHGRDEYDRFVRRELSRREEELEPNTPAGKSFRRDAERIQKYLAEEVRPSANGIVIFACAGKDEFFLPVQVDAPINNHQLFVFDKPHLYPLARLIDESRNYAVLVADTNRARIFVFGRGRMIDNDEVQSDSLSHTQVGGWSQLRYQRHVENLYLHHAKDTIEALDRVVREDKIEHVIIAGDEVIIPLLLEQMPPELAKKVDDTMRLDIRTPDHEIMERTLETFRVREAAVDKTKIDQLKAAVNGARLGVSGTADTLAALLNGQVDELFLAAAMDEIHHEPDEVNAILKAYAPGTENETPDSERRRIIIDELIRRAKETGARIRFIADTSLLTAMGGVGATLRYNS